MIKRSSPDVSNVSKATMDYIGVSSIVRAGGFLHFSGILSCLPDGSCHAAGDMNGQVRHVLNTFEKLMESESVDLDRVVSTTIFTTDMAGLAGCIPIFKQLFGANPPASTWIEVQQVGGSDSYLLEFVAVVLAD